VLKAAGVDPAKLSAPVQVRASPPDDVDKIGQTALMKAAAGGYVSVVSLLANREEVNKYRRDNNGNTALLLALAGGHGDAVRELTNSGYRDILSLTQPDDQGVTLLMKSAGRGDTNSVKALLSLNRENWFRNAQQNGHSFLDEKDKTGKTALQRAEEGKHAETVAVLKEYAAVNAKDAFGRTPLMNAALKGDERAVQDLLDKGADVLVRDDRGQTALMLASAKGSADVVNALLGSLVVNGTSEVRMIPGKTNYTGTEPAEYAKLKDKAGKTAVQCARDAKQEAVLAVLKAYGVME
jgi:ankyrin repeat protein